MRNRGRLLSRLCVVGLIGLATAVGCTPGRIAHRAKGPAVRPATDPSTPVPAPRNVIAFSGGGMYGAFSAGFMSGWTASKTRPTFDVVTGVSTGSLIGCATFLGPDFDGTASGFYTRVRAADVYKIRSYLLIPFAESVASNRPLQQLIENAITDEVIAAIAREHARGRRLYVGTTNLETRRLVVWDMGDLASAGPAAYPQFRDVLLASCAVPGMLPPVRLDVTRDGRPVVEMHADGGTTAPLFIPPDHFGPGTNVYLVVAGKLFPDPGPVRPKILSVLGASVNGILYAHCRAEVASMYHRCREAGANFHVAALPQEFPATADGLSFDPKATAALFAEGERLAQPPAGCGYRRRRGRSPRRRGNRMPVPPGDGAMTYSDFTLEDVVRQFGLTTQPESLFPGVPPVAVPAWLPPFLPRMGRMAFLNEKSRSEFIVAPILAAVADVVTGPVAIFSGQRLNVDPAAGLAGECDFILAAAPPVPPLRSPVVCIVEAKKGDIELGLGQCIAQMVAARRFNAAGGKPVDALVGCVTSGENWQFLRLHGETVGYDGRRYTLAEVADILAIFAHVVNEHYRTAGPAE